MPLLKLFADIVKAFKEREKSIKEYTPLVEKMLRELEKEDESFHRDHCKTWCYYEIDVG
ncbi:MAG: hypothetical protein GTO29_08620 [Candidatus Latescibacteria bacterium]|nr:hypothetical protein [Candidatus Latescibacterota bacterium]NIO56227.1 hypothetical protein [Candidatus Latescibacterota bacterium]